jgi:malonyl-CoA decarboxylase
LADPVAMFHLSNGARLERINAFSDMSVHGVSTSYGVMVNYLYDMKDVESNHEAFVSNGKVMLSDALRARIRKLKNRKNSGMQLMVYSQK